MKTEQINLKRRGLKSSFYVTQEGNVSAPSVNELIFGVDLGCYPKATSKYFIMWIDKPMHKTLISSTISFRGEIFKLGIKKWN